MHIYFKLLIIPFKIFNFGLNRVVSRSIFLRWIAAFAVMLFVYALILQLCIGMISQEVLFVLILPLSTFVIPCIYSLATSSSDTVSLANLEKHIGVNIKRLKKTKNLSEEYLDAFKESVQIFEKDANQRITQLRTLISVFFATGGYLLSLVIKNVSGQSDYILLTIIAFSLGLFTAECFAVVKEAVYSSIYAAISQVKFEVKTAKMLEASNNNYSDFQNQAT